MYSLDINLLSERADYQTGQSSEFINNTNITRRPQQGKAPLFVGMGVAVLTLLASGGGWLFLGQQTTQLEAKQKELDQKLGSLQAQDRRLQELNTQADQISGETQSLASVFNQVQPWSAVLQDLRESIPQGVQIANIAQSDIKGAAPTPAAPATPGSGGKLLDKISATPSGEAAMKAPSSAPTAPAAAAPAGTATPPTATSTATLAADIPTAKLDITGTAKSFDEVNNFILTLKQSAFFNPDETQLLSAGLVAGGSLTKLDPVNKTATSSPQALDKTARLELPKVVEYKIQTSLKRIPAADLIRELERKGAVGLVTRLKSLQQQQVIKP